MKAKYDSGSVKGRGEDIGYYYGFLTYRCWVSSWDTDINNV